MRNEIQRCPFCDEPNWEDCPHKLLEWAPVEPGQENGPLRPELVKAARALSALVWKSHRLGVRPREPRAARLIPGILSAPEFVEDMEFRSASEPFDCGLEPLMREMATWPDVHIPEPEDENTLLCMWSRNPERVLESLIQWRTHMEVEAAREDLLQEAAVAGRVDQSFIDEMYGILGSEQKVRLLTEFFHEGIRAFLSVETVAVSDEEMDSATDEEIDRRIRNCRSRFSFAQDLLGMARDRGYLIEEHIPDGMAAFLLIPDELLEVHGEFLLGLYMEWRTQEGSEYLPHPSEYSGPREDDTEMESQRLISDFSQLVRDWRDGLLSNLIDDLKR